MIARRESSLDFKLLLLCPATKVFSVCRNDILASSYDMKPRTMAVAFIVLGVLCTFWPIGQRDSLILTVHAYVSFIVQ